MKKIIAIVVLAATLFGSLATEVGIFSRLPYGMKFGEPLPRKVEKKMVYKDYQYQLPGKFSMKFDPDTHVLEAIYFAYGDYEMPVLLPRRWRRAGIKLCFENSDGTSYHRMMKIIEENDAFDIQESEQQARKIVTFSIDNDKKYELIFFKKREKNEHGKGLAYITITPQENQVDDDEDY